MWAPGGGGVHSSEGVRGAEALQEVSGVRAAGRPKDGQRRTPSLHPAPSGRRDPRPAFLPLSPTLLPHLPDFSLRSVSPVISGGEGFMPSHFPSILQPSGLLQREMSWRPRPAPLSSRSPPHGPGSQVRGVLYGLSWTRADPIPVAPPSPAAAGKAARTPRRGGAGTAGSNCNTVMTSMKQQESCRLSPGSSRWELGTVLPDA